MQIAKHKTRTKLENPKPKAKTQKRYSNEHIQKVSNNNLDHANEMVIKENILELLIQMETTTD